MLRVVLTTVPPDQAEALAEALIEGRYAACVQILPEMRSTYSWQGEITRDAERLLLIKVPTSHVEACMDALGGMHPYEVPQIIALTVDKVATAYLAWAQACVGED